MEKPVLVIMAAGIGSRYGGPKQIDPMDPEGHILMDFSIYDAVRAGFQKVVFIIRKENEEVFRQRIGNRMEKTMETAYVFQETDALPDGYTLPEGRTKPWGTGHAILSCLGTVTGPFAVINADDYYGAEAFHLIYQYLTEHPDDTKYRYAMVGYRLAHTLTENGHVSRGVCETDAEGYLTAIAERTHIEKRGEGAGYTEDGGSTWTALDPGATVSMNLWGFQASFLGELEKRFPMFLDRALRENPLKDEYFLPSVVEELLEEGRATVQVLPSEDRWYGVTYQEDKKTVMEAIREMKQKGLYPEQF